MDLGNELARIIPPSTPQGWLNKWEMVRLRPDWKLVEKKNNGFLFAGTYINIEWNEAVDELQDTYPTISVICTVDHYNGERWAAISYTAADIFGPRAPTPKESGIVYSLFAGKGTKMLGPRDYGNALMLTYWINLDERRK